MDPKGPSMGPGGPGWEPIQWAFDTGVQLLEAGRATLLLRDSDEPVLVVAASTGLEPSIVPTIRVPVGEGIAGLVAERGIVFFGANGDDTFLSVPVITDRGVEGVLNLTDRLGDKQYGNEHIDAAALVASHIAQLLEHARHDDPRADSGLPRRDAFDEMLERELARSKRAGTPFVVALLNLDDGHESLSDRIGRVRSEDLVKGLAEALQRAFRRYDFLGRFGPAEFGLLLAGPSAVAAGITHRITQVVEQMVGREKIHLIPRIGVAQCPADGTSAGDLLARATARMYENNRAESALS